MRLQGFAAYLFKSTMASQILIIYLIPLSETDIISFLLCSRRIT